MQVRVNNTPTDLRLWRTTSQVRIDASLARC